MTHSEMTQAIESHGDGTHYFVAAWSTKARDYIVDPSTRYNSPTDAQLAGAKVTGTRMVRYTVHQGKITTVKRLS